MSKPIIYGLLLLIMMIWGFNVIAIKVLVEYFAPVTITAFRILTAGIVVMMFLGVKKEFRRVTKQQFVYVTVGALTGIFGHHYFLASGLTITSASNTGLILGLVPLMTTLFAIFFLGDRLTILKFFGILLGLTGVSFIVLNGTDSISSISKGDFYVFCSVITQAISFIYIKKATKTMDPLLITGWMQIIGALFLFIVSFQMEPQGISSLSGGNLWVWGVFFASAILATGIGHMFYNKAIHQLGAGETAIFINLTPFFSLTGSYLFLDETIALPQLLGFIFIVAGVIFGTGALENKQRTFWRANKRVVKKSS
ncbi:DMT family transporter [Rossellomorea sp. BNER]|uniref:DMT family transporter n=1 Tax=Rossellomorea sp. BNER TaxID=2962031 RepID=UPI003AF1F97A|nr:DMT family transporter [Rossellomorea sp. BNER]